MAKLRDLPSIPAGANPFYYDHIRQGVVVGPKDKYTIMWCSTDLGFKIVDNETGERWAFLNVRQ